MRKYPAGVSWFGNSEGVLYGVGLVEARICKGWCWKRRKTEGE
jgi:hypothetical protein